MSVVATSAPGSDLTLVFAVAALEDLADPAAAVADAHEWSRHVGVVAPSAAEADEYLDERGIEQDFDLGDRDKWLAMADIREATPTPRHVFVGAGPEDRRVAEQVGWEYLPVREAAEKAGWEMADASGAGGVGRRLRDRVADLPLWPF